MAGRKEQCSRRREARERERRARRRREEREREESTVATEKGKGKDKEKAKEKEGETEKFGRQFFRMFLPQQYGERLRIPPSFNQYLQNQPTGLVSLKGQSGHTWHVELASDNDGWFFGLGWKGFVRDHSIGTSQFLTFRYDGNSQFSVVIFSATGSEMTSAFHAKPHKDLGATLDSDGEDTELLAGTKMNSNNTSEVVPLKEGNTATKTKRVRETDANGSSFKKSSVLSEKCNKKLPEASVATYRAAETSINMNKNTTDPLKRSKVPLEESHGTGTLRRSKRVRKMDAYESTSKKCSLVSQNSEKEWPESPVGTYKSASARLETSEDSDSSGRMAEEHIPCKKSGKSTPVFLGMSKDQSVRVRSSVTSQRQPSVRSQRPPVSEGQKNYARQKAEEFKSKRPFTFEIMKWTNVYDGFFMIIPSKFVKDHLPTNDKILMLVDPQGKTWDVQYVYSSEQSSGAFSRGWSEFSLGNHLEEFDVCVFELLSEDMIKVHIYRANPEIFLFLHGSSSK